MIFAILVWLVMLFLINVILGSSIDVYNAEIGYEAKCDQPTRLSVKQFFTELLPIIALFVILPLFLLSVFF
jgi:hypothetical protein